MYKKITKSVSVLILICGNWRYKETSLKMSTESNQRIANAGRYSSMKKSYVSIFIYVNININTLEILIELHKTVP